MAVPAFVKTPLFTPAARAAFLRIFVAIFLLTTLTAVLICFIIPPSYCSTARVKVEMDPSSSVTNEIALITSDAVLQTVIKNLDLVGSWTHRYGRQISTTETLALLRRSIATIRITGTKFFEVSAYDINPQQAAAIANEIAKSYQNLRNQGGIGIVELMDRATPASRPCRPNKAKWIVIGAVVGTVFGGLVGLAAAWLAGRVHGWRLDPRVGS